LLVGSATRRLCCHEYSVPQWRQARQMIPVKLPARFARHSSIFA
jgi:hypothetical protein